MKKVKPGRDWSFFKIMCCDYYDRIVRLRGMPMPDHSVFNRVTGGYAFNIKSWGTKGYK